jgi:hypothetical protein
MNVLSLENILKPIHGQPCTHVTRPNTVSYRILAQAATVTCTIRVVIRPVLH